MGWSCDWVRRSRTRRVRLASSEACATSSRKRGLAHVVGAGAGDQDAAGREQAQGAQVDLLVAGDGGVEIAAALGEGRRIEHDQRKLPAGGRVAGEQVEDVGLVEVDVGDPVGLGVGAGGGERGAGAVDRFHGFALGGQVQGEAAGGGEAIERLAAAGVMRGGAIVFALVEEDAGLLAVQQVGMHGEAVDRGPRRCREFRRRGWRFRAAVALWRGPATSLRATMPRGWKISVQAGGDLALGGVHALVERLHDEVIAVAVDHQGGKQVGLAVDYAVGVVAVGTTVRR